ncbi:MAG: tetratricopeptide repeat protein [Motiliproteus sp.]
MSYNYRLEGSLIPRSWVALLLLATLSFTLEVRASEPARAEQLDQLFFNLKQAPDEASAQVAENQIWKLWITTGNPAVDQLMRQAMDARRWYDFDKALSLLDQVVDMAPNYAEAWNQRATVYFQRGDYEQALEQVARTLELEPRHFGALAGRGIIRLRQGRPALAIQNIKAAMAIHPYLQERNLLPTQF